MVYNLFLGGNRSDAADVKAHQFFRGLDWQKLADKKIAAPFKPNILNDVDTSNFSDEFTRLPPTDAPSEVPDNHERLFRGQYYWQNRFFIALSFIRTILTG